MLSARRFRLFGRRTTKIVASAALMGLAGAIGAGGAVAAPAESDPGVRVIELEAEPPTSDKVAATPDSGSTSLAPRIAGGRPANDGEFAFAVDLEIVFGGGIGSCTGTVISPEWVLSAAHCVTDASGSFLPDLSAVNVTAGATELSSATPANQFSGVAVTIPGNWLGSGTSFANDWALVQLDRGVSVRGLPIPPTATEAEAPGVQGTIAGYGFINEDPDISTSRLHVGKAPILSDADCGFYFGGGYIPGLMNCTGPPPGAPPVDATTCRGDSGGPLFVPFGSDYLHAGITSFGPYPCQVPRVGGYAKTSTYAPAIANTIQADQPSLGPPSATTGPVTQQHDDGLTVSGTVDPNGIATAYEVQWGTTPALGAGVVRGYSDPESGVQGRSYAGMGSSPVGVSARISGAPAGTEIFYRVSALSAAGTDNGSVASGQTNAPPPPPPPPAPAPTPVSLAAAPTEGNSVCNPAPTRQAGKKGTIRLTSQALAIQQRIDAAALRRLNAANVWINQGIVPTDLCAGSLGPNAFQAGINWVGGAPVDTTPPSPRALRIIKKKKRPADFTVSRRQVRINDTISRALFARAEATEARIQTLTGGNLAPETKLTGRPLWPGLATSGPLPASQAAPATPLRIGPLPPAGRITVSTAQLKKTQQRSQEAIRIANRANDRITQGLTEQQFRPGSIGTAALG